MIRRVEVKSTHSDSAAGRGSGRQTRRVTDQAATKSRSGERSAGALMHVQSLQGDCFAIDVSGQHDSELRTRCMSQRESQVAATHADMATVGVYRLSTTKIALIKRIRGRAERCHVIVAL